MDWKTALPIAQTLLTLTVTGVIAAVGWRVQRSIATSTQELTKGQLEITRQKLVLDLMDKRIKTKQAIMEAINDRLEEIDTYSPNQSHPIPSHALSRFWQLQDEVEMLFSPETMIPLGKIAANLAIKADMLVDMRDGKIDNKLEEYQTYQKVSFEIEVGKGVLGKMMDAHHYLGDVRVVGPEKTRTLARLQAAKQDLDKAVNKDNRDLAKE